METISAKVFMCTLQFVYGAPKDLFSPYTSIVPQYKKCDGDIALIYKYFYKHYSYFNVIFQWLGENITIYICKYFWQRFMCSKNLENLNLPCPCSQLIIPVYNQCEPHMHVKSFHYYFCYKNIFQDCQFRN